MKKIQVVAADSSPAFRAGLCRSLSDENDIEVVGEAADGEETVKLAAQLQPDVILVDIKIPGLQGIETARQIKKLSPKTSILIMSEVHQESDIIDGLHAGASGYLLKTAPLSAITSSIRVVSAGNFVFDIEATASILHKLDPQNSANNGVPTLANRETEVVRFAAGGLSNKEIASEMGISERTVQTHLTRIFKKLGVRSRTEMVLYSLKGGLITLGDLPGREKKTPDRGGKPGINYRLLSILLVSLAINAPLPNSLPYISVYF